MDQKLAGDVQRALDVWRQDKRRGRVLPDGPRQRRGGTAGRGDPELVQKEEGPM